MALGLTQPLTEMSTRNISWEVKAAGAYGWQPYYLHVPIVLKSGRLNLLKPSGPVQACNEIALPLPYTSHNSLCNVQSILQRVSTFRLKPPGRTHRGPQVNWYNSSECMWARRIKTPGRTHRGPQVNWYNSSECMWARRIKTPGRTHRGPQVNWYNLSECMWARRIKTPGRTHRGPQVNWYNLSECMWARRIKTFPTKHLIKVPKFCSILFLSWKGRCCEQIFYHV